MNFATTLVIGLAAFNFVALSCGGFLLKTSSQPIDPVAEAKMIDNLVVAHYLANLVFSVVMLVCYVASDED